MTQKVLIVFVLLMVSFLVTSCGLEEMPIKLKNGQNYYCYTKGYLDVIDKDISTIKFSCSDEENRFEVTFKGSNNDDFIDMIRKNYGKQYLGVILQDDELIQMYRFNIRVFNYSSKILWSQ